MDLYFASGPWSPVPGLDEKSVRFLCSDWDAHASLTARGLQAEAWEDHFPLAANAGTVAETERLAEAWRVHEGRDFTELRGVSLGRAYRWLHWVTVVLPSYKFLIAVQSLLREHAPRVVHAEDTLLPEQLALLSALGASRGFETRVVRGRRLGPEIQVWRPPRFALSPAKLWVARAFNALARLLPRRGRPRLLVSNYRALDPVLEELIRSGAFWLAAADMPSQGERARFLRGGGELLTGPRTPPPARGEHADACARIRADWARARRDPAYLGRFVSAGGDSLWPALEPSLEEFFKTGLEPLAWVCARYHALWDEDPPAAVLLPFDEPPLQNLLMGVAAARATPAVTVLHGLPEAYHQLPFFKTPTSELVVWGPEQKALYEKAGALGVRRGHALGNPAFDRLARQAAAAPPRALKRVLALSQPSGWSVALATNLDPARYALQLAEVFAEFPTLEVVLRIHPSESPDYYRRLLGPAAGRISVEYGGTFAESLERCDLLVASYSTALIEAMLAGKPLLCTQFSRALYQPPFDGKWDLKTVRTPAELSQRLRGLIAGPEAGLAALLEPYPAALDAFAGSRDGGAARRVAGLLRSLVGRSPEMVK